MALIPSDVGIRMRMQAESQLLQHVQPVSEIPADLLELRPGQAFSARIQEVLPENTYKALVAGKSLTLSLPEGAKTGDTLELVVVDRSPKSIIAHRIDTPAQANSTNRPYPFTTLSPAGQLIGNLLPAEGQSAKPAELNRGQPLLPQAPRTAADLIPALTVAIKQSGLFYESHQAQWVSGRLPLQQLLQEPQAVHSNPALILTSDLPATIKAAALELTQQSALAAQREEPPTLLESLLGRSPVSRASENEAPTASFLAPRLATPASSSPAQPVPANATGDNQTFSPATNGTPATSSQSLNSIPDDLRPIVQQQLDALATQRMAWHGEVWPNQQMQLEVDWQGAHGGHDEESPRSWGTTLSLITPRLGEVHARLLLTDEGVSIAIATPVGATAADLRNAAPALEQSLSAAGIPLLGFLVRHDEQS